MLSLDNATAYGCRSHNENGHEEVFAEFSQTFWQWLTGQGCTKRTWYRAGNFWFRKEDGTLASNKEHSFIVTILYQINMNKMKP